MSSSHSGGDAGASAGNAIKQGAAKIHGIGEAIRGNINEFADTATGTDSTRSRNVAERGEREFQTGHYEGTGAGVTPHDTEAERVKVGVQGEGQTFDHGAATTTTTTGAKPPLPERGI